MTVEYNFKIPTMFFRYHVEDIMYHEDIRRAQLMTIVDKFRGVLVKQEAEDPAITAYFKKSIVR